MDTVVERPAALDVHKQQVTACVRVPADGGRDPDAPGACAAHPEPEGSFVSR
jgi:hypothetical protein